MTEFIEYDAIQDLRDADRKSRNQYKIIAQRGGQENMLSSNADIIIGGGCRGGSKSFSLLLETMKDIENRNFRATILRANIDSLSDLIDVSSQLYQDFGTYNRAKNDMQWNFDRGGFLKFNYHEGAIEDFKVRFQGRQFCYIGVDEITHIDYAKFKYLITCNRNAHGLRNRFFGTCNPDPDSWVAKFIDWWIGEDGLPIPERDGKVRYCFMDGDDVTTVIWGDSKEEVFEECKETIMRYWKPEYEEFGSPADLFVKSVAFVEAKLADNYQLMRSDPTYLANLAGQSAEQRARDLEGNWRFRVTGSDIIKMQHMIDFYENAHQLSDNIRRVSCDVALEGGDRLTMWLWIGNHIQDVYSCRLDAQATVSVVKAKLREWQVLEENFVYDLNGLGQLFKGFFKKAVPFNNAAAVSDDFKYMYGNLKSQAAYMFAEHLKNLEISINPNLLDIRFSGKNYTEKKLSDILMNERKAIARDKNKEDKGFCLVQKKVMISIVGHSPDFIEGLMMKEIFNIKKNKHTQPKGIPRRTSMSGYSRGRIRSW